MSGRQSSQSVVLSIGHSTRPLETFLSLLKAHGVERVIDVRTIPRSRRNPQFNRETLAPVLRAARIGYTHLKALGGLRHARADSPNRGWRNASFRGFADYMQTPEFEAGIERLIQLAASKRSAMLCAEAVPWRCHRSLVADALVVRGFPVEHILSATRRQPHRLTSFARVRGNCVTYPAPLGRRASESQSRRSPMIQVARVYDKPSPGRGARYLVERLWPRGMKKEALKFDAWLKDVAPSDALRRWFGHKPERWPEFRRKYLEELRGNAKACKLILEAARRENVTLLYSARDTEHNGALVLRDFLLAKLGKK